MKINSNHDRDAALLDAILQDDDWRTTSACFIAEVDGKKMLVFLDRQARRACLAESSAQSQ